MQCGGSTEHAGGRKTSYWSAIKGHSYSLTAKIGQFKHCNSLVHFFLWGTNVLALDSNEHYFRSRNLALTQDSHSLRGSTRDLWTVHGCSSSSGITVEWRVGGWWWDIVMSPHDNEWTSMRRTKEERPSLLSLRANSLVKKQATAVRWLDTNPNANCADRNSSFVTDTFYIKQPM
jgi:hypothetical protein